MRTLLGVVAVVALSCTGGAVRAAGGGDAPSPLRADGVPVVVELFSSEGCSSCPPADGWLAALDHGQPIDGVSVIALEEHVDYWDGLGWRDPFGQPQFGERQAAYSRVLPDRRVFTPEIVVDGHLLVDGGNADQAARALGAAAAEVRAQVSLSRQDGRVAVDVSGIPGGDDVAEVWLAVTESGLTTDVAHGENAGRRLVHAPVVRSLRKLGAAQGSALHAETVVALEPSWAPRALRLVAFVQRAQSRRILGAGAL
jgi:hypothetical protein